MSGGGNPVAHKVVSSWLVYLEETAILSELVLVSPLVIVVEWVVVWV